MCGIAGIIGAGDRERGKRMTDMMQHRGPDDAGHYVDDEVTLSTQRLAIRDPEHGHQPMTDVDGGIIVTFNGEIYNHEHLRRELEEHGHRFKTDSDTEIIVHAYEEWGSRCVSRFDGMFALGIWDSDRERLLLARDRFGQKPLYYTSLDSEFLFASEAKALIQDARVPSRPETDSINQYLAFGYVPGPDTMFSGIRKLPPGHRLLLDDDMSVERYWQFTLDPVFEGSMAAAADILRHHLDHAVQKRVADEPVGVYLSGGVDSGAIAALLSQHTTEPVATYTAGIGGRRFDERGAAQDIVDAIGAEHTAFAVDADTLRLLPDVAYHFDEPVADPAAIPTLQLSRESDERIVYSGTGGDELFGGYEHYPIMRYGDQYVRPLPHSLRDVLYQLSTLLPDSLVDRVFPYASALGAEGMRRLHTYLQTVDDPASAYLAIVSLFDEAEREEIASSPQRDRIRDMLSPLFSRLDVVEAVTTVEVEWQLPDNLLQKLDRMTMATGTEARTPILDRGVASFAQRLTTGHRLAGMSGKQVFRRAVKDVVPTAVRDREKQRMFVPVHDWLQERQDIVEAVRSLDCGGLLDERGVDRVVDRYERSPLYRARQLWTVLQFTLWYHTFIAGDSVSQPDTVRNTIGVDMG